MVQDRSPSASTFKAEAESLPNLNRLPVVTVPTSSSHQVAPGMHQTGEVMEQVQHATSVSRFLGTQKIVNVTRNVSATHPYARLQGKNKEGKRRKIWNHALEKYLFTPYELSTLGAPHRRTIYMASLEAHIDNLHAQLLSLGFWPVAFDDLEALKGLNTRTAKSVVAGLQYDATLARLKILELERVNDNLERELLQQGIVRVQV
ncbi:hypothetical protein Moror_15250 [Moniliophthora roreri MCA 2997]|uniref:Uncharacterized protein n=1 Tax=Moniliophthora roreri (strain MCA 2997) TaxID=1381753 RepID=V2WM05_MONRO|nr:hypothetical protein Moror_15250 [Moniliophthora roreri MCA 2997]